MKPMEMIYNEIIALRQDVKDLQSMVEESRGFIRGIKVSVFMLSAFVSAVITAVTSWGENIMDVFKAH